MRIVLLGPPGAGKGTQAEILATRLGVAHVATGDLFRREVKRGTPLGRRAAGYMRRGELIPDELVVRMVAQHLTRPAVRRGFALDGFPRTVAQAEALDAALGLRGESIDLVLDFRTPVRVILRRLTGRWICQRCGAIYHAVTMAPNVAGRCDRCPGRLIQRIDDKRSTIVRRLQVYRRDSAPVVRYYARRQLLHSVRGDWQAERLYRHLVRLFRAQGVLAAR
ncbi:MAG: adenylate kinase [Candidatus Omnitrophica bacterium]|nr:adenylate kinase [Candidatus Omnitrophota bacterium]